MFTKFGEFWTIIANNKQKFENRTAKNAKMFDEIYPNFFDAERCKEYPVVRVGFAPGLAFLCFFLMLSMVSLIGVF